MPKMTHPNDPTHLVDVADEKVAVYEAQGWSRKTESKPVANSAVTRAAFTEGAPVKKTTAKKAAKKPAA